MWSLTAARKRVQPACSGRRFNAGGGERSRLSEPPSMRTDALYRGMNTGSWSWGKRAREGAGFLVGQVGSRKAPSRLSSVCGKNCVRTAPRTDTDPSCWMTFAVRTDAGGLRVRHGDALKPYKHGAAMHTGVWFHSTSTLDWIREWKRAWRDGERHVRASVERTVHVCNSVYMELWTNIYSKKNDHCWVGFPLCHQTIKRGHSALHSPH